MPFQPGQSGNPSGRRSDDGYLKAKARAHAERAVAVLVSALEDEDAKVRLRAAEQLLDRGFGRPPQAIVGDDSADPIRHTFEWKNAES